MEEQPVNPVEADALLNEMDAQARRAADLQVFAALHNATLRTLADRPKLRGKVFQATYKIAREAIAREWQRDLLLNELATRADALPASISPAVRAKVRNTLSFVRFGDNRRGRKTTTEVKLSMTDKYQTEYTDDVIEGHSDVPNLSGRSPRENLRIEEGNQRRIAESEKWYLARRLNPRGDSKDCLQGMGFVVGEVSGLFYEVNPPSGWTKSTDGYWTSVLDCDGHERISQFYKGAWYDQDAFLNIKGN